MLSLKEIKGKELEQEVNLQFIEKLVDCNDTIKQLKFRDCSGRIIAIKGNWDSITVSVEQAPEQVEKFVVVGTTNNGLVDIEKIFDEKEKAEEAIRKEKDRDYTAELEIKTINVIKVNLCQQT